MADQPIQLEYAVPLAKRKWRERRRGNPTRELVLLAVDLVIYTFAALFFLGLFAGIMSLLAGSPLMGFVNVLAGVVLIPTLAAAVFSARRRRAAAVLGYVHQAVRLNQPLNRVLAAAARGEKGRIANRLLLLKEDLEAGISLGDALAGAVPEMPIRTLALIDYALKVGRLDETLNRLVAEDVRRARRQRNDQPFAAWYPFLVVAVWCAIVGLLGLFVAPKFKQILLDFHMQPPAIFQLFDSVSDWIWVAGPVIVIILLACLGMQIRQTVRIPAPIWVLRPWRDWLFWYLPILHGLIRDRNMSDICISLADSVQLGYPLEVSLERLGQLNVNTILRQRILNWADGLRAGIPPVQAARQAPMPHLLVGMMSSARDNAQLAEVLSFVGRFHTDRFLLRREANRGAVIPVFTIFFGIVVALMALSIFVPLQELVAKYSW